MNVVTVHEARTNLSRLIAKVIPGGKVAIAPNAVPAVCLVPAGVPRRRRYGALRSKIAIDARFDEPIPEAGPAAGHGERTSSAIHAH